MRRLKVPPQITRLVLLTVGIVTAYFIARYLLTPPSFGEYGWYRGNALAEIAARPPIYAGRRACDECHADVAQKLAKHEHKTVSCEACHGVALGHAQNPDLKTVQLTGSHCIRCHEANPSRPAWLRQINVKEHYGTHCIECHLPHEPNQTP